MNAPSEAALDARARRAARRVDLIAEKSRERLHINNLGGYQLISASSNTVEFGVNYDLSAVDVIDICGERAAEIGRAAVEKPR
jgi:hypothetical protein